MSPNPEQPVQGAVPPSAPAPERISHERAMEAARRFIRAFFDTEGKRPEIQIPARPTKDDDCLLIEYIQQQSRADTQTAAAHQVIAELVEALEPFSHETVMVYEKSGGRRVALGEKLTGRAYKAGNALTRARALKEAI